MKLSLLLLLPLTIVLTGCAGSSRAIVPMAGAGVGTVAGYYGSGGNPLWTAVGGVGGAGAAAILQNHKIHRETKAFQSGYDKGRSDSVKEQYWMQQNLQQTRAATAAMPVTLYPIPIPEQDIDGVKLQPTTRILRIHQ